MVVGAMGAVRVLRVQKGDRPDTRARKSEQAMKKNCLTLCYISVFILYWCQKFLFVGRCVVSLSTEISRSFELSITVQMILIFG